MNLNKITNEELVDLYQKTREDKYFNALYHNNIKLITAVATKRTGYDTAISSSDEYLSECKEAFFRAVITFSNDSSAKFGSVAYQYMNNACKQVIRRNNMKKRLCIYDNIPIHSKISKNDNADITYDEIVMYDNVIFPEYQSEENELYELLKSKVYHKHVQILDLLNEGYNQKEISVKLGCSHQKVSSSVKAIRLIAIKNGF